MHRPANHYVEYELVVGAGSTLNHMHFTYDPMRVQWAMKTTPYGMPSSGAIIRSFYSIDQSLDGIFLYVGTSAGEMMVFRRDTHVFRACIPACTHGLRDILAMPDGTVLCAGGDGTLNRLRGRDGAWQKVQEVI